MILSMIIPCFNEEKNLPLLLERIKKIQCLSHEIEFVIVNNGSQDNSAMILPDLVRGSERIKVVTIDENQGYGYGILKGLENAQGDFLGWTHADLQTDIHDVLKALDILKIHNLSDHIYVKGKRRKRNLFDNFFTFGMSVFETLLLRHYLNDINAQPNIFHQSFFKSWVSPPKDFSLDLFSLYMAKKAKLEIIRFDVLFPPRQNGVSSRNRSWKDRLKFIKRTISYSFTLKKSLK